MKVFKSQIIQVSSILRASWIQKTYNIFIALYHNWVSFVLYSYVHHVNIEMVSAHIREKL